MAAHFVFRTIYGEHRMTMTQSDESFQEHVLRAYTVLRLLRADWGGALLFCCGLGSQGAALAMAANIAGAVCLSVEAEPELLKGALRSGACDFIVTTLDEALRAMKNEARKHLPISVGLQGDPNTVLRECLERGVQPEMLVDVAAEPAHEVLMQELKRLGAIQVIFEKREHSEDAVDAFSVLDSFVQDRRWELRSFNVHDAVALRTFDAYALQLLAEDDTLRRQWLRSASRIVQRQRPLRRALWVTVEEGQMLENRAANGAI